MTPVKGPFNSQRGSQVRTVVLAHDCIPFTDPKWGGGEEISDVAPTAQYHVLCSSGSGDFLSFLITPWADAYTLGLSAMESLSINLAPIFLFKIYLTNDVFQGPRPNGHFAMGL